MFEQGYVERQINAVGKMIAALVAGKSSIQQQEDDNVKLSVEELEKMIIDKYVKERKINEAENYISKRISEVKDRSNYALAIYFYNSITYLSDAELLKANYSREEVVEGINALEAIYNDKK